MTSGKQKYFNNLAKEIFKFYIEHRAECQREYSIAEDTSFGHFYETIGDENKINQLFATVSTAVLTANKYEKNILHAHWCQSHKAKIQRIPIKLFPQREFSQETYAYFFKWHGYCILHIEAQATGSYTVGGIADIIRYIGDNPYLYPTTIISLGICFGIDENRQVLGDTYISNKIYPYFMGAKWDEKGYFVSDNHMFRLNSNLYGRIKSEILDTNVLKTLDFNTDFGNYITGEAVISNKDVRDIFVGITTQDVSAGDMESYGLFKECCGRNVIIPCLTVKSICDWGVLKNFLKLEIIQELAKTEIGICQAELKKVKDSLQAFASFHAYSVLDLLLKNHVFSHSIQEGLSDVIQHICEHERVIYFLSIQKYVKEVGQKLLGTFEPLDGFLEAITKNLGEEGILYPCVQKSDFADQVWKIKCHDNK